ncbi:hypothetical protein MANES_10G061101v8 [Manihot esculenta]|uniref:Uncharacterized protein n=1 Tax=Manihot esculenta TaxID=3983 RepID=A0ACB7GYC1_MANES|nr:hypothetical protein MANES_10G061101v8 [Manihot esculenta]
MGTFPLRASTMTSDGRIDQCAMLYLRTISLYSVIIAFVGFFWLDSSASRPSILFLSVDFIFQQSILLRFAYLYGGWSFVLYYCVCSFEILFRLLLPITFLPVIVVVIDVALAMWGSVWRFSLYSVVLFS